MNSAEILQEVARQVAVCEQCALHFSRKRSVPGEGPHNAEVFLIGEGPGFYENEQGRPFVGQAGKFLDDLLHSAGLKRPEVFVTNVVKCRPPGNRDPQAEELIACNSYLERQIDAVQPRLIVTLGRFSMAKFFQNAKISEIHGQAVWVRGRLIVPMYHPAAALHQASLKPQLEQDFFRLPEFVDLARSSPHQPESTASAGLDPERPTLEDKPTQLSLF
ncbi:MAG TPA: uracil-DNA glycosylase [Anaerolineaceae bacterium]|nr:uracil-DNA glycosylase [Anaerolineaceae bacterium]